ncbi:MAG: hypothetical protein M1830_007107 [Pleopsidium flavum]|nr:MAG: hypothetical protein M1830_007107 [Pleopsidium flavum]
MPSDEMINIDIGGTPYTVNSTHLPYFHSLQSFHHSSGQSTTPLTHSAIPLFDIAYCGVEHGCRHCIRMLGTDLSQYHTLCDTLDFLCVDVLGGRALDGIMGDLKSGKAQYELEYKYYRQVKSSKGLARDAAFRLVYLILTGSFEAKVRDSQKVYNAVLFVVLHSEIFKYCPRKVVRDAYEERFRVTEKQRGKLELWPAREPGVGGRRAEEDVTSEVLSSSSDECDWDDY